MTVSRAILIACTVALFGTGAAAQVTEVRLKLPVRPKLVFEASDRIGIAPFVLVSAAQDNPRDRASRVDALAEFQRYLNRQLSRQTENEILVISDVRLPGTDMRTLEADAGFWRDLGRRSGADFLISGVIDFDVEDNVGYRTEEYVNPLDGRTYYRQVLVETTGFVFDIVIAVFDADTGEKLVEENFRDFKEFEQREYDELLGLFENLRSLESRLVGIFASQETTATRYLFTP